MRYETQLNIRGLLVERINRIFRETRYRWFTHAEIVAKVKEQVWDDERCARLPQYQRSYLRGYLDALYQQLWAGVTWVFPWYSMIYDSWMDLPDDAREFYKQPHNPGFHVYKTARDACFSGSQEVFDLLYAGGVDRVKRADQINREEYRK